MLCFSVPQGQLFEPLSDRRKTSLSKQHPASKKAPRSALEAVSPGVYL